MSSEVLVIAALTVALSFVLSGAILAIVEETSFNPRRKYRVRIIQKNDNTLMVSIIGPGIEKPIQIASLYPGSNENHDFSERLINAKVEAQDKADALNASRRIGR